MADRQHSDHSVDRLGRHRQCKNSALPRRWRQLQIDRNQCAQHRRVPMDNHQAGYDRGFDPGDQHRSIQRAGHQQRCLQHQAIEPSRACDGATSISVADQSRSATLHLNHTASILDAARSMDDGPRSHQARITARSALTMGVVTRSIRSSGGPSTLR